ncbi:MAG: SRPBCC family protein [Desulfobacterales bacterium]|nr:SRPBCC family protein [Desulfobacterales bacterium]
MSFVVDIAIEKKFDVPCSADKVFEVLADVPRSVSHFPNVNKLLDMGENTFRWEMNKLGFDKYSIQIIYACKYVGNKEERWVKWTPIKDVGNGMIEGSWNIKQQDSGTHIDFNTQGKLTIPLPALVKFIGAPIVEKEFNRLVDHYIENLKQTFRVTD